MSAAGDPGADGLPVPYEALFDLAPDGYLVTDMNGVIRAANRAFCVIAGRDEEQLLGKPLVVLVDETERSAVRSMIGRARRGESVQEQELHIARPDGPGADLGVTVAVDRYEEGGWLLWLLRDLGDRRRAEREARAIARELELVVSGRTAELVTERARLSAVVSQIPVGVAILDADGVVVSLSDEAMRILGDARLAPGRDAGDSMRDWLQTDGTRYDEGEWPAARTLATGERIVAERLRVHRGDGSVRELEVHSSEVTRQDQQIGAVLVFSDVTERDRVESAQRDFVTNAAHELQSPIAAIVSAIEVLQSGAKAGPDLDVFLGHIEREAVRLARLVRGLLALAHAELGVDAARSEVVSVAEVLASAADELRNGSDGTVIAVDAAPELAVAANRLLLERVVANLAGNALKYGAGNPVRLGARRLGEFVEILVEDGGPGIPLDEQTRVFDRFYRGQTAEGLGFGLGLPIALAAVHALGGQIELDSEVGRGTTVHVTLPHGAELR